MGAAPSVGLLCKLVLSLASSSRRHLYWALLVGVDGAACAAGEGLFRSRVSLGGWRLLNWQLMADRACSAGILLGSHLGVVGEGEVARVPLKASSGSSYRRA